MKSRLLLGVLAATAASVVLGANAQSAPATFTFTVSASATQGVFGDPGTTTLLNSQAVDASLVGQTCQVTIDVANNDSVREGTDLIFTSGSSSLTEPDVEAAPGDAPPAVLGEMTLGTTVSGSVRFGPEGVASIGATLHFDCVEVSPTTVTRPPTTPPEPPTEVAGIVVTVQPTFTG